MHGYKIPFKEASKVTPKMVDPKNAEKAEKAMEEAIRRRGMKQIGG